MKFFAKELRTFLGMVLVLFSQILFLAQNTHAMELDWSGQFWSEFNFVHNYAMDSSDNGAVNNTVTAGEGGYYIPRGGQHDANFQSLFLRLRPKVIVNDNIYIKSEFWLGDPIYGIFGNAVPYSTDQRSYYSNQSRGSVISAQRFWGEFVTDIGTFQVGRVPLNFGLGVIWNSGENLWDRYMSTGDAIRWIAKFGSFSVVPSFIVNSSGNNIGGSCILNAAGTACASGVGSGGVTDYSLIFKYENTEEELEGGVNLIKRLAGASPDPNGGLVVPAGAAPSATAMNFMTYDLYARKKWDKFTLGGEVPIIAGSLGAANFQAFGIALEANWKPSETWETILKAGQASGQPDLAGPTLDTYRAFYFNPNYHLGMVMFNYQLANFAGPQTQNNPSTSAGLMSSPYNNPIVNATYAALGARIKPWDKWTIRPGLVYARSPQAANGTGYFYNTWSKSVVQNKSGKEQSHALGWEFDLGLTFQWDEYFQFSFDNGFYFPGAYYAFSNTATDNPTSMVFASSVRIGVSF